MATNHFYDSSRFDLPHSFCDLGAQYITVSNSPFDQNIQNLYELLQAQSIFFPLALGEDSKDNSVQNFIGSHRIEGMKEEHLSKRHFVAPKGTSSIISHLVAIEDPADVNYSTRLTSLSVHESVSTKRRCIRAQNMRIAAGLLEPMGEGSVATEEDFDAVVLTLPAPQLMAITGLASPSLQQRLSSVRYSSR